MRSRKFRYLPHTADIAFVAYGKSLEAATENAAEALLNVMLDLNAIKKTHAKTEALTIKESATSAENLVWYTLQDILTHVDEKKLRAQEFRVKRLVLGKRCGITGSLLYKKIKQDPFLLEVKAVTPHNLSVRHSRAGYEIRVLLDV